MRAINGYVDAEGRLINADPRLLAVHVAAGGTEGGLLGIPQLVSLARIARSLAIPVSRPVTFAEGNRTVEVLARARLQDGVVHIALSDPDAAEPIQSAVAADDPQRAADFASLAHEGHWETDSALKITKATASLGTILGGQMPDPLGKNLASVFLIKPGPDGNMPMLAGLAQRCKFDGQWAVLGSDQSVEVILSGEPIEDEDGHLRGFRGAVRKPETSDVDPAEHAPISDVAQRLDGALRSPIGRIIKNADAIHEAQEGDLHAQYQDYAADIAAAGRHLLGLVDDLGDLQAIERSDFRIEREELDLADVARRAAGLLSVRAADQKVRIDRPDEDEVLPAYGEFRRVLQILVNLIGNAIRYSPENSMVWIRTEQDGDLAVLVVADQGKGIAVDDQARIFEKFERVDTSEPGGNGLGLYIARRLARAMGGDITVDSAPGLGARFALTLPARPSL